MSVMQFLALYSLLYPYSIGCYYRYYRNAIPSPIFLTLKNIGCYYRYERNAIPSPRFLTFSTTSDVITGMGVT